MISYHGTSTYSYGTSFSMTRTRSGSHEVDPPYSYTYEETSRSTSGDFSRMSVAASTNGTENVPHNDDTTTMAVSVRASANESGQTLSITTYTYTYIDGTSVDSTAYTTSAAVHATSVSLTTSSTTSTGITTARTTTATVASSAHTLTTDAGGASVTASAAATATVTTSTTSTSTRSTAITTGTTLARVASMGTFSVYQAATDEIMALGAPTSINISNEHTAVHLFHRSIDTDLSITASRTVSVTNWNIVSTSFTVPPSLTTYTYTVTALTSFVSTFDSFSVMTSTTSTAAVADPGNAEASATSTITVWSTTTRTSKTPAAGVTFTTTATYEASHTSVWSLTMSERAATTRSFWGHGAGLTATTYAAHCRLSSRTVEMIGWTGAFVIVTATSTTTELVDQVHATTATAAYQQPANYFADQAAVTDLLIEEYTTESLGASFTIVDQPFQNGSAHELALRYAARAQEPGFLPARQPWSGYAASDSRYLALTISANGSTTTALARPTVGSVHYGAQETTFSHTFGGQQSAVEIRESLLASYTWASNTQFTDGATTWLGFFYTETGSGDMSTRGLGGYERKRPSFSDLAAVSVGAWAATTQEGTTTGTTTHASTVLTGSDARRTAFEPVAVVRMGSEIAPPLGSFKTTNYAA